jgi:hypothetical protein
VGPRAGLDTEAIGKILLPLPGIEPRLPGHPVSSYGTKQIVRDPLPLKGFAARQSILRLTAK